MRNASGQQFMVRMSGSEKKVNENTDDISALKRVTKGLFTWREQDPRRQINFTLDLHAEILVRVVHKLNIECLRRN